MTVDQQAQKEQAQETDLPSKSGSETSAAGNISDASKATVNNTDSRSIKKFLGSMSKDSSASTRKSTGSKSSSTSTSEKAFDDLGTKEGSSDESREKLLFLLQVASSKNEHADTSDKETKRKREMKEVRKDSGKEKGLRSSQPSDVMRMDHHKRKYSDVQADKTDISTAAASSLLLPTKRGGVPGALSNYGANRFLETGTANASALDTSMPSIPVGSLVGEESANLNAHGLNSPIKRRRKVMPRKKTFAEKLMAVLSDESCSDYISWMPDGITFVIPKPSLFTANILPKYFKQSSKFESFTRKLNRWGFKRVHITSLEKAGDSSTVAYCHSLFQRNDPELCSKMKGDGTRRATDEEREKAIAAGLDPRRAQGLNEMTPQQIATCQKEQQVQKLQRQQRKQLVRLGQMERARAEAQVLAQEGPNVPSDNRQMTGLEATIAALRSSAADSYHQQQAAAKLLLQRHSQMPTLTKAVVEPEMGRLLSGSYHTLQQQQRHQGHFINPGLDHFAAAAAMPHVLAQTRAAVIATNSHQSTVLSSMAESGSPFPLSHPDDERGMSVALNDYYNAKMRLIVARFEAESQPPEKVIVAAAHRGTTSFGGSLSAAEYEARYEAALKTLGKGCR